jgi:hypothetical protein
MTVLEARDVAHAIRLARHHATPGAGADPDGDTHRSADPFR